MSREPKRIDAIYAWVNLEPDGGEGVIAWRFGEHWMPLVGADIDRVKSLRPYAEASRAMSGRPTRLVRFGAREELELLP